MRGEYNSMLFAQTFNELSDFDYLLRVKTNGRLVKNEFGRIAELCLSKADTLAVAL